MSKRLGGIIGCKKYKTSSWDLNGFPDGCCLKKNLNAPRLSENPPVRGEKMSLLYNVGEKPTVILLYTIYTNRHAVGTPDKKQKQKQKQCSTPSNMVI